MTSRNPQKTFGRSVNLSEQRLRLGLGYLDQVVEHEEGDDNRHYVRVQPRGKNTTFVAQMAVTADGDVNIPSEVDDAQDLPVVYGFMGGNVPVVLATLYGAENDVPPYKPGERRIGHALSDANIFFDEYGNLSIEGKTGTTATFDELGNLKLETESGAIVTVHDSGDITLESDGGATVTLESGGDVTINGGSKGAIYDIDTTTDSDGHVTSVDPLRRTNIFI